MRPGAALERLAALAKREDLAHHSLRGDLAGFAAGICQYLSTPLGLALARALATPTGDPAITEASARYFQTRFEIASAIVDRAIARGEIPKAPTAPWRSKC